MSALATFKSFAKGDRRLGKVKPKQSLPYYVVYRDGSAVGCGHQHLTLTRAANCAINHAFTHPHTNYSVWEVVPSIEPDMKLLYTYNTEQLHSDKGEHHVN